MSRPDPQPTDPGTTGPDPATLPYEAARDELLDVVRRLESGSADLEESLALWERGERLAERCQEVLDGAMRRLDDVQRLRQPDGSEDAGADSSSTTSTR